MRVNWRCDAKLTNKMKTGTRYDEYAVKFLFWIIINSLHFILRAFTVRKNERMCIAARTDSVNCIHFRIKYTVFNWIHWKNVCVWACNWNAAKVNWNEVQHQSRSNVLINTKFTDFSFTKLTLDILERMQYVAAVDAIAVPAAKKISSKR